jgi:6-phosphogluconolactonase
VTKSPLFIGTYTRPLPHVDGKGNGVYSAFLDDNIGQLSQLQLAAEAVNPSYLWVSSRHNALYCVNEGVDDERAEELDYVTAYAINSDFQLTEINRQSASGAFPCHVTMDRDQNVAIVSNYGTGNVVIFSIGNDGSLSSNYESYQHMGNGPNKERQDGPHAHGAFFHPHSSLLVVADLGIDAAVAYRLQTETPLLVPQLSSNATSRHGSGPRHASWSPNGNHLLVANELASTVSLFRFHDNNLSLIETISSLASDTGENSIAAIRMSNDGKFAYVSNRGHDSIAVISFDEGNELLKLRQLISTAGKTPRDIALSPNGRFLLAANQDSDTIYSYQVDSDSGELAMLDFDFEVPTPVCLTFANLA